MEPLTIDSVESALSYTMRNRCSKEARKDFIALVESLKAFGINGFYRLYLRQCYGSMETVADRIHLCRWFAFVRAEYPVFYKNVQPCVTITAGG